MGLIIYMGPYIVIWCLAGKRKLNYYGIVSMQLGQCICIKEVSV